MRRTIFVGTIALLALGGLPPSNGAQATPASGASAIGLAATQNSLLEDVAYSCYRVWRCGAYSCGWRRACSWDAPYVAPYYYGYYRPYSYYYSYGYYPRWRYPHHHHRGW